jgi:hypothetical protein
MKIIMKKNSGHIIGFATIVCLVVILLATCNQRKKNVLVVERENSMLRNINKTLTDEVSKSQDKILVLEEKIENMEILNEKQAKDLAESMQNLEYEIVKTVEETKDTTLISLFDEVAANQESLISGLENTIKLKDSVISEKDKIIESYVFATEKMSNEIERLHAENNEMLINEMISRDKIKKRNRIIVAGGAIVAAGITTAILINR